MRAVVRVYYKKSRALGNGIRRDQTKAREKLEFINSTDMEVIKIAPFYRWTTSDIRRHIDHKLINNEYLDYCKINNSKSAVCT